MEKLRVFEGRLEEITVVNNRYFSSNNILRALPSLHADMMLTRPIFEAELDRANANQDRQIYPAIEPGLIEGTSALKLTVKDRFPLHAKVELNSKTQARHAGPTRQHLRRIQKLLAARSFLGRAVQLFSGSL